MADQDNDKRPQPFHIEGDALVLDPLPDPKETARQRREDEQHEFARSQAKTNRTLVWFNGGLLFATVCTIGVGIWQAKISQTASNAAKSAADTAAQTLKEMQNGQGAIDTHTLAEQAKTQAIQTTNLANAARSQALATKQNADAAKSAADTASESLHTGERAYVIPVVDATPPNFCSGPGRVEQHYCLTVQFINVGKTPAIAARLDGDLIFPGETKREVYSSNEPGEVLQAGIMGHTALQARDNNHTMPPYLDIQQMTRNKQSYRVYGTIQYQDIFNEPHTTDFCIEYPFVQAMNSRPKSCGLTIDHPAKK